MSPPWCLRCSADEDDDAHLLAVAIHRTYVDATGRKRSSVIPARLCRECAKALIEASGRVRGDWLATSRHAPRARTPAGTWASRAQMQAASGSSSSPLVALPTAATGRDT